MKNVLVIDAPDKCVNCPLSYYGIDGLNCKPLRKMIEDEKPEWCPLRPLPKPLGLEKDWRKDIGSVWIDGARYGWNACLDKITGETDESNSNS